MLILHSVSVIVNLICLFFLLLTILRGTVISLIFSSANCCKSKFLMVIKKEEYKLIVYIKKFGKKFSCKVYSYCLSNYIFFHIPDIHCIQYHYHYEKSIAHRIHKPSRVVLQVHHILTRSLVHL